MSRAKIGWAPPERRDRSVACYMRIPSTAGGQDIERSNVSVLPQPKVACIASINPSCTSRSSESGSTRVARAASRIGMPALIRVAQ